MKEMKYKIWLFLLAIPSVLGLWGCTANDEPNIDPDPKVEYGSWFVDYKLINTYIEPTGLLIGNDVTGSANSIFIPELYNSHESVEIQFSGKPITEDSDPELFARYREYYDDFSPNGDKILSYNERHALGYMITGISVKAIDNFNADFPAGSIMDDVVLLKSMPYTHPYYFINNKENWSHSSNLWSAEPKKIDISNEIYDKYGRIPEICPLLSEITEASPRIREWGAWGNLCISFHCDEWNQIPTDAGMHEFELTMTFKSPLTGDVKNLSRRFKVEWKDCEN